MSNFNEQPSRFTMNRDLQRTLLLRMREVYPNQCYNVDVEESLEDEGFNTIFYLQEHGLCDARLTIAMDDSKHFGGARITPKGLDFLENDGGLSAIFGVVTVKFHADTVRALLEAKIDTSDLPQERKSALREALRKLPGSALQAGVVDLMKMGLDHAPEAIQWLGHFVGL